MLSCASMGMRNNLHPARGRKRFPVTRSWKLLETIYTPQGDGNELPCPYGNNCMRNNLHPARGRKPPCTDQEFFSAYETIYTPQGDGNVFSPIMIFSHHLKQSTPRKGTETHSAYNPHCISQKQSTPREGTETRLPGVQSILTGETIYTPQGDGNSFYHQTAYKLHQKQSTPRKGTETIQISHISFSSPETIYTPQGDGNTIVSTPSSACH